MKFPSPFAFVKTRLSGRQDSEHEQALVRLSIYIFFFSYLSITSSPLRQVADGDNRWPFLFACFFVLFSFAVLAHIIARPGISRTRRAVGIAGDVSAITFLLHMDGLATSPLYIFYLWVVLGNGFRFGNRYLFSSAVASMAGFVFVVYTNDYWNRQLPLAIGLFVGLIILPAYSSVLIKKLTLAMKELEDAKARAEESSRAKSKFLANMSHELRTPLNGIMGMAELLVGTPLTAEQKDFSNTIHDSTRTMLSLVEDILDISRIEAGKLHIERMDFDLHDLLKGTTSMLLHQAHSKGLRLSTIIHPNVPFLLRGDPVHLRQVLLNLLSNAVKFTENGEIILRVLRVADTPDQVSLRFEVSDTGIGMTEEQKDRIFERFTQADETITRKYGGTGLGTTISKQLVELMGGAISVTSAAGTGSTFWFTVPFEKQNVSIQIPFPARSTDCRFLIVASDASLADTLCQHLGSWNIRRDVVSRSATAFSMLVSAADFGGPYHAVIVSEEGLDMQPIEFSRIVSSVKKISGTRLILVARPGVEPDLDELSHQGYCVALDHDLDKTMLFNAIHFVRPDTPDQEDLVFLANRYRQKKTDHTKLHILVAEDNAVNQKVIGLILEKAGHAVRIVENGELALDALKGNEKFDLALLDLNMPVMGGIEVAKIYQYMSQSDSRIPIVALTADATVETRKVCEEANFDAYVTKPFESKLLLETIYRLAQKAPANGEGAPASPLQVSTPEPSVPPEPIDHSVMKELIQYGASEDFLRNVTRLFLEGTDEKIRNMTYAVKTQNSEAFRQLSHALKGSAGQFGALHLSSICDGYSKVGHEEFLAEGKRMLGTVKAEYARICEVLQGQNEETRKIIP